MYIYWVYVFKNTLLIGVYNETFLENTVLVLSKIFHMGFLIFCYNIQCPAVSNSAEPSLISSLSCSGSGFC